MKDNLHGPALLLAAALAEAAAADEKGPGDRPGKKDDGKAKEVSIWMQKKLEHSQKALAGLTSGDFDAVQASAASMKTLNFLEEWDRGGSPEYKRQLRNFADANAELARQAGRKNLGGATLAYTQLTLSCVQCHSVVRDAKKGK